MTIFSVSSRSGIFFAVALSILWDTVQARRTYNRPSYGDFGGGGEEGVCYQPYCAGEDYLQCQMRQCFGGILDGSNSLSYFECMQLQYCTFEAQEKVTINCAESDPFDDDENDDLFYLCVPFDDYGDDRPDPGTYTPNNFDCNDLFYGDTPKKITAFANHNCRQGTGDEDGVVCTCKEGQDCYVEPDCDCSGREIYCACNADKCPTSNGDPHFKTWSGHWYDYHGECELVLLHAPNFADEFGLDIHIRTKLQYAYSFIESAALRIGEDILEVTSYGQYYLNSISNAELPTVIAKGKVAVTHIRHSDKQHEFNLRLQDGQVIQVKTFKNLVSVEFAGRMNFEHFEGSVGLLGAPKTGDMLARDGVTLMTGNPNDFGADWQVRDDEPNLFLNQVAPQYPQACKLPEPKQQSRRLGETIAVQAAEEACAHWVSNRKEMCVFDVLQTGDLEVAQSL